jgi:hypothetical protein
MRRVKQKTKIVINNFVKSILILITFFAVFQVNAQEHSEKFKPHHSLGLIISHTQISQGIQDNGNRKWLSVPSWGINYNYVFSSKWAIGLHTDIVVEDYVVEQHLKSSSNETLERSYPIGSAVMATYKPFKHFYFLLGAGGEFEKNENFFMLRAGVEYSIHLPKNWELVIPLTNDLKFNAYNSFNIGIGMVKKL